MFRQEALDRLSSPEQLDQLMRTINPRAWMILVAFFMLLSVAVAWSIFGSIGTRVTGVGILMKGGGVLDIVSLASGQLTALYVDVGQPVQRGEVVARIAQPELSQQLEKSRSRLAELKAQHERVLKLGSTDEQLMSGYVSQERGTLVSSIKADRERLAIAKERVKRQEQLFQQGLITKQALEASRDEMRGAREAIGRASTQIRGLSVSTQGAKGQKERENLASELRINESEREISLLEERLELTSRVISPHSGRVLEVRAREGDVVGPGKSILNLEPAGAEGSGLEALIYVPLAKGKTVRPGMRLQIAPDSVRKEEHGVMLGIVTSVSEFPTTEDGMKRVLGNDLLVRNLLGSVGLAPIAVQAEIVPDAHTKSGYRWSSRDGPPLQLGPGTPCQATITVRQTRPIGLVIPLVREYLGV